MPDFRINGNLILIGSLGGTIAFGCQPSGGGFTILLPTTIPQVGQTLVISSVYNGNTATAQWATISGGGGGGGSVNSVGLSDGTGLFVVGGTPITTSGILTLAAFKPQTANTVLRAGSGTPSFSALTQADLPVVIDCGQY